MAMVDVVNSSLQATKPLGADLHLSDETGELLKWFEWWQRHKHFPGIIIIIIIIIVRQCDM